MQKLYGEETNRPRVLIIEDDASARALIHEALSQVGIDAAAAGTCVAARDSLTRNPWSAAIVDLQFPGDCGLELVREVRASDRRIPIIALGAAEDFEAKIAALRAGASALWEKNGDWRALASHVLLLTGARTDARVLLVEDDPVSAAALAQTLRAGGYTPRICPDPRKFEEALTADPPDLVLMDIHLPHFDGIELTRFLRQDARFETIPVIYVTASFDHADDTFLIARTSGEQVLRKPVPPQVLLGAVASRLHHFRRLRALVEHDAQTGALTRRAFLEHAAAVVASAKPEPRARLCFAMIDIDGFKAVNDQYGHSAGDRVLLSLSETLQRNVRSNDLAGRYGGEEFVVLLENVSEAVAVIRIEQILRQFRLIDHPVTPAKSISATFSAGVAAMRDGESVDDAIARADRALYRAKRSGKNQVSTADSAVSMEWVTKPPDLQIFGDGWLP
jgi:diguanylate cyclase (GGDEF)-like protein